MLSVHLPNVTVSVFNFKGKPNCLNGLIFVLSGVYDSLERDEAADLIKEYGGKVTTSLSKKTSYIVLGEEAGLAKVAKADDLGTKRLSEDGLLDLIRIKSGMPSKETQGAEASSTEWNSLTPKRNGGQSPSKAKDSPKTKKEETRKEEETSNATVKKLKEEIKTPKKKARTPETSNAAMQKVKEERKTPKMERSNSKASTSIVNTNMKFEKSEDIPFDRTFTDHEQNIASVDNKAWVEKYKPTDIKQIIGQQGAASNVVK